MKSLNILLDDDIRAIIADFGIAKEKTSTSMVTYSTTGTYAWMAPEVMQGEAYNEKVDVYGFGMVLWELLTNELPFAGLNDMALLTAVAFKKTRPPLPPASQRCPQELLELVNGCWKHDPSERFSLDEILYRLIQIEKISESTKVPLEGHLFPVNPQSAEFERLIETCSASMQQHHEDYVIQRIKYGCKPISL